jgi:DNA gyrase subunit A
MTLPLRNDLIRVGVEEEMKSSYLQYAMSVIVSRALPDVRDGLKPVHRRILFAMKEAGNDHNKSYRKSYRAVGEVVGKYHPHGDMAVYDAMVRMAQPFSMSAKLIDGQGNFGSIDGDPAAAPRYTEVRLSHLAHFLLEDIDKKTIEFTPNYDDKELEPVVLPARFPNLLVNGAGGIAVAMATNIPPHNLGEVINACVAYILNPEITLDELMTHVLGPDFPTGGIILGRVGIRDAATTGRGSILVRGRTHVETLRKDREAIIVTEVPYQVNKARMIEQIADHVRAKTIEGISDLRDESDDRNGIRVVVELKRDASADVVLNQLYRFSQLQVSFSVNALALHGRQPQMMNLKDIIGHFLHFREEVVVRRLQFDLAKARDRAHALVGLGVAVANISDIIDMIRAAPDPATARQNLMDHPWPARSIEPMIRLVTDPEIPAVDEQGFYRLSEAQARAILDLRLHRLTGLERDKIAAELSELAEKIDGILQILGDRQKLLDLMIAELHEVRDRFAVPRRTEISDIDATQADEDLIQREDMVVTVSMAGYIKRVPLSTYRAQRRGGKGRSGMTTREEDCVSEVFVANTHAPVLFFSSLGRVYQLKVYRLPIGTPQARGKAMVNLLPLDPGETISTVMPLPEDEATWANLHIVFATSAGNVRRNALSDFLNIKANGKIAMKLDEGERLIAVQPCTPQDDILLTTTLGKCIRFEATDVRQFMGRTSTGVRGIKLAKGDHIVSMSILGHAKITMEERAVYLRYAAGQRRAQLADMAADLAEAGLAEAAPEDDDFEAVNPSVTLPAERIAALETNEEFLLTVTERGYGKRTSAYEYRLTNRGGQGVANIDVTEKNGRVVASFPVKGDDHLVLVTDGGQLIRCPVHDIRIAGRKTQGVTLFRVAAGEKVVSVSRLAERDETADEVGDAATSGSADHQPTLEFGD